MSGRKRDRAYTRGVPETQLRAKDKLRNGAPGLFGRHAAPSQESVRRYIESGLCPFCAASGYANLAGHTSRTHGVSGAELREMAGMFKHERICSPELSETFRAMGKERPLPENFGSRKGQPHALSEAGRASQREKSARLTTDQRRANARSAGDKILERNRAKHEKVLDLYAAGKPVLQIASMVGVRPATVLDVVKRAGVWVDGRSRRRALD